jgi:hypothetical protein
VSTALVDLRAKVAAALAPVADTDPAVLVALVDAVQPPALMLGPVSGRAARSSCLFEVAGVVTAIAARLEPGAGMDTLDTLVAYVLERFAAAAEWAVESWSEARVFTVGGIVYLGSRITFTALVEI